MKNLYFTIIALITLSVCKAQIVDIPDANFKYELVNLNCVDNDGDDFFESDADFNDDGEIQVSEAEAVLRLRVSNNISSLEGISSFINLQILRCHFNQLTSLDVSALTSLNELGCKQNQLTSLNVSGLTNLNVLDCNWNQLTTLDLSGLTNLTWVECVFNQLTSLDVSGCTNLNLLLCNWNQLTTLDVSGLANLTNLSCDDNQLTTLDASGLANLTILRCASNQLTSLFIKNGSEITEAFDFSNNPNLEYICVDDFELDSVLSQAINYGYTNFSVNTYCSFVPGGEFYVINGETTLDSNNDGCDINDVIFPNLKFNSTDGIDSGVFVSGINGGYSIPLQTGIHTIMPVLENPLYFAVSPTSVVVDFPTDMSPNIQDFCITPVGVHNDVEIVIVPLEQARPGFDTNYKLVYKNKGNTVLSGTIDFLYNDNEDVSSFVNSNPVEDNHVNSVLTWNYANLMPFESRVIILTMSLNTPTDPNFPLNGGDILSYASQIFPVNNDETPSDNGASLRQLVVNSFDPNDKTCLEGETIAESLIGRYVHYMIRFENTGTANAINVVVKDIIDINKFDLTTLIPLNSSHNFITRIQNTNEVEFIFENINLPFDDANNDGYVVFKIETLPTLSIGDTFTNDAEIYFDFNLPILTNDYLTTIEPNLSISDSSLGESLILYPNPVLDRLYIEGRERINSITIYDVNGRLLQKIAFIGDVLQQSVDMNQLSKGIYFVTLKSDRGEATFKIVKD